jgi:hypothetical protein
VIRGYVAAKRYEDAYRLFRFTLPVNERSLTGFVHNSSFKPSSYMGPFSWQYRNTRSAEVLLSTETPFEGATVRFLGTPTKEIMLNQTLFLPPGRYRLFSEVEASNLRTPRSLYWQIRCLDPKKELLRLPIPEGSYKGQLLKGEFAVEDCGLQQIGVATDVIVENWQNRYSGYARIRSLRIERAGSAEAEH